MRGPGRREVGHGHLAERAIAGVLPSEEKLAYYVDRDLEIPWPRPALLLPGIIFSHQVHVVEGELDCEDCHEDIIDTSTLPDRTNFKYEHAACGDCHEVQETGDVCLMCHPR